MQIEESVQARYAEGAQEKQEALCCPVSYQSELLALLPEEIIEKDYGCGDPSRYVQTGDVVLDLGSGGGKVCYMAAQLVGEDGCVHGVDMTGDMLALARKYQAHMAEKIGGDRVHFHKGYIQDLAFDIEAAQTYVNENPLTDGASIEGYEAWKKTQRRDQPMIASESVSLVISNCVLNLVGRDDRRQMLNEIFRVLKPGGRVAISDIICDQYVPEHLQNDPQLWSGCISGAFQEQEFLQAFAQVGFVNVAYDKWEEAPWQVVEGIEFRSVTLVASKPNNVAGESTDKTLMYVGPMASVSDEAGRVFPKGERVRVSASVYEQILQADSHNFVGLSPTASAASCCAPKATCC